MPAPSAETAVGAAPQPPLADTQSEQRVESEAAPQPESIGEQVIHEPVLSADTELRAAPSPLPTTLYPEDSAPNRREVEPLKPPPHRSRANTAADGPVVGTRPAVDVRDLALVSTLLEAAKFRKLRPPRPDRPRQLRILRSDLRSYRRAPAPQQLFVLVLDYTSLAECDWQEALLPHLSWAYVERAAVCLVQIGSARATNPFRAEPLVARNLLSPQLGAALDEHPGAATPLAHGLELAGRAVRAGLEHGRGKAQHARMVVLTDARGNVPLAASHAGTPPVGPVARQGVDDALRVAAELRALRNTEIFVLDPQPSPHAELPLALAEALGAVRQTIPALGLERTGT
jgi:magnesium chelatase subunit D